jgi:branched-chain amino acid transport system substrate-binding protein
VKFDKNGEWVQPRILQVQFHDVKGKDVEQFRMMGTQTVVSPAECKTGEVIPYEKAK